jgi:hypothetical protein
MYPAKMLPDLADVDGGDFQEGELLAKARDEYGVKLVPIQVHIEILPMVHVLLAGRVN